MNLLVTLYTNHYQFDESANNNNSEAMNITWSPYDTIIFKEVDTFSELCFEKSNDKNTTQKKEKLDKLDNNKAQKSDETRSVQIGVRQRIHLIDVCYTNGSEWSLKNSLNDSSESFFIVNEDKKYNFYCIYLARFSEDIHRLSENEMLFDKDKIREQLYEQLADKCKSENVEFKFFRSLGVEDFTAIFLADTMSSLIPIAEELNMTTIELPKIENENPDTKVELFSTVSVFPGFNNPAYDAKNDVEIMIRLNPRRSNTDDLIKLLKDNLSKGCNIQKIFSRKAAMLVTIPKGEVSFSVFGDKEGIFNGSSKFYRQYFFSSRTYFFNPENNNINGFKVNISECDLYALPKLPEQKSLQDKDSSSHISKDDSDFISVTDFIVGEYNRMIKNSRFCQWRAILNAQENALIDFAKYYCTNDRFTESKLLRYMQSALHLINQACSPAAEIPNHTSYYAGSFHGLLKAYYGIIKMLFDISFTLPHGEKTNVRPITFAICLNPSAQIRSELFTKNSPNRLVVFFLPYDSFWDYSKNIQKLVHEVFHYVPPYEREIRAEYLVNIMYIEVLEELLKKLVDNIVPIDNSMFLRYTRFWADYLEERFLNKSRTDLSEHLHKHFPNIFLDANPEWLNRFLISGKKIYDVLLNIESFAKEEIVSNYGEAMKYIAKKCEVASKSWTEKFKKHKVEELLKHEMRDNTIVSSIAQKNELSLNTTISDRILDYINASKEAFCDLWAIKIIDCSIPDYIVFLFEMLRKSYSKETIMKVLESNYKNLQEIEIPSFKYRICLLMRMQIKTGSTRNKPETMFKGLNTSQYLSKCLGNMVNTYKNMCIRMKYSFDEFFEMTFKYVDQSFERILQSDMSKYISKLRTIYKTDAKMPNCINDIDYLGNYIGLYKLHKPESLGTQSGLRSTEHISTDSHQYTVTSVGNLVSIIDEINTNIFTGNKKRVLWFRGVCDARFSLLPSILRTGSRDLSIYANQSNMIKNAYFNASHISWLWNLPIEQRTACLQHYGVPTNLLDFSLNPLTAMHFALNPNHQDDKKKIEDGVFQPVIYVFDPTAFSIAVKRLKEGQYIDDPGDLTSIIFDINQNEDEKNKFFVSDMSFDFLIEHTRMYNTPYVSDPRVDQYPAPIVIQQSNPRIVLQNGYFVAYPLNAKPYYSTKNRYDYLDLLTIQARYLGFLKSLSLEAEKFIQPIYIRKEYIPQIKRHLNQLVISKGSYYPELANVLEDAMSDKLS